MVNWLSDEDLALENGDKRQCEHCGQTYWVDEWHSCEAGAEASRRKSEAFNKNYFGAGAVTTTEVVITVTGPDTEMARQSAIDQAMLWKQDGQDDVLKVKWTYQERKV